MLNGLLGDSMVNCEHLTIIQGKAPGADFIAGHFYDGPCESPKGGTHASHDFVEHESYPADWGKYGRAAGPIRNKQMLDEGEPDLVVAFSEIRTTGLLSTGTQNMVDLAKKAGVPVWVISHG